MRGLVVPHESVGRPGVLGDCVQMTQILINGYSSHIPIADRVKDGRVLHVNVESTPLLNRWRCLPLAFIPALELPLFAIYDGNNALKVVRVCESLWAVDDLIGNDFLSPFSVVTGRRI